MNPKTREILDKINRIAYRAGDGKRLIQTVDLYPEHRETLKRIVDDNRIEDRVRTIARQMLEDPRMYRTMERVDDTVARRMEESVERDVKRAIAQGHLEDPSKSVADFMKDKK